MQGVGEAAVAVGQFGAAQQALFRAEAAVAQGFGNRGGVGGEEVAAFFEKADEFGKLAAGVEQHGGAGKQRPSEKARRRFQTALGLLTFGLRDGFLPKILPRGRLSTAPEVRDRIFRGR